jgi:limonene-1,2-epoxide hydrolase
MSTESGANMKLVEDFVGAFNANDLEAIMSFFTDDAIYHNIPMAPVSGLEAIRTVISGFLGMSSEIEWIVHNAAASAEGVVLNERTDRFLVNGKWIELPVMGAFEIHAGKIAKWRDYFDMNQFQSQMTG